MSLCTRTWVLRVGLVALVGLAELIGGRAYAQYVQYIHTDALGSPVAVTDQSRRVIERNEYEPYGKVLGAPVQDGPGYTGHVSDAATGLSYMQQRYYDPEIGRFIGVDPVKPEWRLGDNFNRYWYANNNPYGFIDPDGRLGCTGSLIKAACDSMGMLWQGPSARTRPAAQPMAQAIPMPLPPLPVPIVPGTEPSDHSGRSPGAQLIDKMAGELAKIVERKQGPEGVQYSLRAIRDGVYPNRNTGGFTYLKKGEVWKYGQTTTSTRYSAAELNRMGLLFVAEYRGGQIQILIAEKAKIYGYRLTHDGNRPPGNPIDR